MDKKVFAIVEECEGTVGVSVFGKKKDALKAARDDYELDETDERMLNENGYVVTGESVIHLIGNIPLK